MSVVAITYFPPGEFARGTRYDVAWPVLVKRLATPRETARKEDAPGFSLASFVGGHRLKEKVERVYAVGLDLDHGLPAWRTFVANFQAVACFVHTTWSSSAAELRARAFLRLSRPVTAAEYGRVWKFCRNVVVAGGLEVDEKAKDPSRFWYVPSSRPGTSFDWAEGCGDPINVDGALAQVPADPELPPALEALDQTRNHYRGSGMHERLRVLDRAEKYLAACDPAISGQGGHDHTFIVAQRLVRGFLLDESTAFNLMTVWNARCQPPWKDWELKRKIRQAAQHGTLTPGSMLEARR